MAHGYFLFRQILCMHQRCTTRKETAAQPFSEPGGRIVFLPTHSEPQILQKDGEVRSLFYHHEMAHLHVWTQSGPRILQVSLPLSFCKECQSISFLIIRCYSWKDVFILRGCLAHSHAIDGSKARLSNVTRSFIVNLLNQGTPAEDIVKLCKEEASIPNASKKVVSLQVGKEGGNQPSGQISS